MRILNTIKYKYAIKFREQYDFFDDDTGQDIIDYESQKHDDFEMVDWEANEQMLEQIPTFESDEDIQRTLADDYVEEYIPPESVDMTENLFEDKREISDEIPWDEREEIPEEPLIKKRDEVDEVDESVAEETEVDERVPDFATTREALEAAMNENRVVEIFYKTKGRGSRDEDYYLKRERGLIREDNGGVDIHRIVEPHNIYTAGNGRDIVITYDRSVRKIRSFIIDNIYDYNFTKNKKTQKDQYFKPRNWVMPKAASVSGKGIKIMKNVKEKLTKITSTLEDSGLKKSSDVVKGAIKALSNYKMAQYVGVQGYWLKNRRCWDNCYRQKRSSQPNSPAQEVWMECWDEYKDSINNEKSSWSKYAKESGPIKISSTEEREWNRIFADKVDKKVKEGLTRPEAVYSTIEAESKAYTSKMIEASSDLMALADTLISNGQEDIGKQMAEMSIEVLKEAEISGQQNWIGKGVDKVKGFFGGMRGAGSKAEVVKKIQNAIGRANELLSMLNMHRQPSSQKDQQVQASEKGFIIEAGKGITVKEAKFITDPKGNTIQVPDNANTTNINFNTDTQQKQNTDTDQDGVSDADEERMDTDQDGVSDADEARLDTDQDGVTDDKDVDADGDNIEDSKEKQRNTPVDMTKSYLSFIKDVAALSKEFSGLQSSKDTSVAQIAKGATSLFQQFVNNSTALRQMRAGSEQRASLRETLQSFITGLQGVLANPNQDVQQGQFGRNPQVNNQQVNTQQGIGEIPESNIQGAAISQLAQSISTSSQAKTFAQVLSGKKASQEQITWLVSKFEEKGIPFTVANFNQFSSDLSEALSSQRGNQVAASIKENKVVQKKAFVATKKRK